MPQRIDIPLQGRVVQCNLVERDVAGHRSRIGRVGAFQAFVGIGHPVAVAVREKIRTFENEVAARRLSEALQQWNAINVAPIAGTLQLVKLKVVPIARRPRSVLDNPGHAASGIGEPPQRRADGKRIDRHSSG